MNDRCILTGTDAQQEWMLPWWLSNVRKHMPDVDITIADFGMSEKMQSYLAQYKNQGLNILTGFPKVPKNWFLKPQAMLQSPYKYTCWLDTDCEVLDSFHEIFDYATDGNKLGLTTDIWALRNKKKAFRAYWQSGVVVFKDKPEILHRWAKRSLECTERGDMEALYALIGKSNEFVNEMPQDYQWLRLSLKNGLNSVSKKIMHWTGRKGKLLIEKYLQTTEMHDKLNISNVEQLIEYPQHFKISI